jgi:hypothetical protein
MHFKLPYASYFVCKLHNKANKLKWRGVCACKCHIATETIHKLRFLKMKKGNRTIKWSNSFTTGQNDELQRILNRIQTCNWAYFSVLPMTKHCDTSWRVREIVYERILRIIVLYGTETWMFSLTAVKMIDPFERKIDRKIFGPMQAKRCGILDRHTAWRFTKCMMVMHSPKVLHLKTCS